MNYIEKHGIRPWDAVETLDTEEGIQAYLEECWRFSVEDKCPALFVQALEDATRARGILQLANTLGLPYRTVYKTLRDGKNVSEDVAASLAKALHLSVAEPA